MHRRGQGLDRFRRRRCRLSDASTRVRRGCDPVSGRLTPGGNPESAVVSFNMANSFWDVCHVGSGSASFRLCRGWSAQAGAVARSRSDPPSPDLVEGWQLRRSMMGRALGRGPGRRRRSADRARLGAPLQRRGARSLERLRPARMRSFFSIRRDGMSRRSFQSQITSRYCRCPRNHPRSIRSIVRQIWRFLRDNRLFGSPKDEPGFQVSLRYPRPLLLRWEQAHRHAVENHVHPIKRRSFPSRSTRLGIRDPPLALGSALVKHGS